MSQYIDKADVVVNIKRRISLYKAEKSKESASKVDKISLGARIAMLEEILSFINTLESKEVDLEKEIKDYIYAIPHAKTGIPNGWRLSWYEENVIEIAKHFYELGIKAKGE